MSLGRAFVVVVSLLATAVAARAEILVSSRVDSRVAAFSDSGAFLGNFISSGLGGLNGPVGLRINPVSHELLVASNKNNQILRYSATTGNTFLGIFASGGNLNGPSDLAFSPTNDLYVANFGTTDFGGGSTVARFQSNGTPLADFATGLSNPTGIVFGPSPGNQVFVANFNFGPTGNGIFRFTSAGALNPSPQTSPFLSNAQLAGPSGLTLGPDGKIYAASLLNGTTGYPVVRFDPAGSAGDVAASGGALNFPAGLLFLPNGDMLVSNSGSADIIRYTPNGLGGFNTGTLFNNGPSGNGGLIQASQMLYVTGITLPEPSTLVLACIGCAAGAAVWRRNRSVLR
jgi:PEP-CTERM motif